MDVFAGSVDCSPLQGGTPSLSFHRTDTFFFTLECWNSFIQWLVHPHRSLFWTANLGISQNCVNLISALDKKMLVAIVLLRCIPDRSRMNSFRLTFFSLSVISKYVSRGSSSSVLGDQLSCSGSGKIFPLGFAKRAVLPATVMSDYSSVL